MAEASFSSFFNNAQPFGLNVKVPEKTMRQIGRTAGNVAGGVFEPIFDYLEKNENVFSGDITKELNRLRAESFTTAQVMNMDDVKTNGPKPKFDVSF